MRDRVFESRSGRYLSVEPLLESPSTILLRLKLDALPFAAYAYASNNPLARSDQDGLMDSQAKKNGQPNATVRRLEEPLRRALSEKCAREASKNLDECRKKASDAASRVKCDPEGGLGALKKVDEERKEIIDSFNCDKGARCEYEACMGGANSGVNTTDYMLGWQRCMSQ